MSLRLALLSLALLLGGCDALDVIFGPDPRIAQREADAKAIGAACRYARRGIEDCYRLNEKASKTSVYQGWREMDEYMRENKIEGQRTVVGEPTRANNHATAAEEPQAKPAKKQ